MRLKKSPVRDALLEANLGADAVFAKNHENGQYILERRLALAALDGAAFDVALGNFVNQTETWRKFLADFRPFAETAAEAEIESPAFGAGGFMQV